ncbi:MAG: hypothetical protein KGK07_03690 [Chloroflexota bacterium]|nr:hypothetical protein [Chloroflexota bacterium]
MMDPDEHTAEPVADEADDEDDDDEDEVPAEDATAGPQVPAYIAIIRIIAVLGMGLSISFGLFIMLVGVKGVIIGIPIILLSIPCYYGMQLAERLVARHEGAPPPDA